ncbi:hypothetical protein H180DRAFT_03151 [Streptomyces sp. WMMB 322]|nr:hypothetical protein H180DRAFT_03151 [Streptomyces sp. WMMB 322]
MPSGPGRRKSVTRPHQSPCAPSGRRTLLELAPHVDGIDRAGLTGLVSRASSQAEVLETLRVGAVRNLTRD